MVCSRLGVACVVKVQSLQVLAAFVACLCACPAAPRAADLVPSDLVPNWLPDPYRASSWQEPQRYEARLGVFAHDVAFPEQGSVDINGELVFPRLPIELPPGWMFLVPRPQVGLMANTVGKTSYVYAGVVWTFNVTDRFIFEPVFGGAVHDGKTHTALPGWGELGCSVLFHTGISLGYRLDTQWTLYATWEHISNANLCMHNIGNNDFGGRIGYKF
jgi:lipid A 3-O-deacylase